MPQLAIDKDFLSRYAKLDKRIQKAVDDALHKFAEVYYAGGHLEKVTDARDPRVRTLRITQGYRGVVIAPDAGDSFLLVTVLPHDEAYAYIRSRRFSVNHALGVLEVRDEGALESFTPALEELAAADSARLFDHISDADLIRLGVDAESLPIVRLLTSEAHLEAMAKMLPGGQYDALVALASGMTPEEAWAEVAKNLVEEVAPDRIDPDDLTAAIRRSPGRAVFVEGPEGLQAMLEAAFDLWRVFLHPQQRRIAYRPSFNGPAMVTGGAGTGKTVAAVHRVAHLASRYESGPPQILLTTFTKTLDAALRSQVELLITDPAQRERVDVRNLDRVAYEVVSNERGAGLAFPDARELEALWEEAGAERAYVDAARRGRGTRLSVDQKRAVWRAVLEATERMSAANQWTFTQVAATAAEILERTGDRRYEHVVVDEAQDLHPAKWRLIRALVGEGPDDLFIAGDPHQRIYDHRVSLASLGINVRGRSRKLTVSYRSTQEILSWAVRVLDSSPATGLDDLEDNLDTYSSPLHGRRPAVRWFADRGAELDGLVEQVREWLDDGVEAGSIGIAARTRKIAEAAGERLKDEAIGCGSLARGPGVRVGTMHAMKGLEFRCVAVVGADEETVPRQSQIAEADEDPAGHARDMQRERNLLFVSCTRARDALHVSYSGEPSPFLPVS
ncbi:UvrD-helicase domain-containing protein [Streptomonospora litoralis]|uniref:DNA 3'-5' helicase n=1 Tax=Streptomonospora litoralis TaxID=2498135 RepID=A0A4P6Q658_9ACTN|nr:UvrD-helicase domain-containing protein [Streptomonospora litoralis]QBI54384.1 Putative ATP-dependent DNA helicase YjcD [Streptomonospora litoralis]